MKNFFSHGLYCQRYPKERSLYCNVPQFSKVHSPTGLDWGYVGSGPDDLALNTLLLISDPAFAKQWHQLFTVDVIQYIPYEGGSVPIEDIRQWVQAKQKIVHI